MPGTVSPPQGNRPPEDQWLWTITIKRDKNRWHTFKEAQLGIEHNGRWSVVDPLTGKDLADSKLVNDEIHALVKKLNGGVEVVQVKR
jgi:hypothetical protein